MRIPDVWEELCSAIAVCPQVACADTLLPMRVISSCVGRLRKSSNTAALCILLAGLNEISGLYIIVSCLRGLNNLLAGTATGCAEVH